MRDVRRSRRRLGFTLIELVIVLVVLGVLAAIAAPRFIALATTAERTQVKATANTMRSAVAAIRARGALSATDEACGGSRGYTLPLDSGEACLLDAKSGPPFATTGRAGTASRSTKVWELLVGSPRIQEDGSNGAGWRETSASDCGNSSFTYCWDYYSGADEKLARLRYNEDNRGSVELLWRD